MDSLVLSQVQKENLELYINEIMEWKELFNLTGARSREEFETFHIKDCILPLELIRDEILKKGERVSLADLGTGAGLPLIPLSILLDDYPIDFVGIERSHKRTVFLKQIISKLSLKNNIKIIEKDIKDIREQYDFLVFRAFRTLSDVEKDISSLLKRDAIAFAYKGNISKAEKEVEELVHLKGEVIPLNDIDGHSRSLSKLTLL